MCPLFGQPRSDVRAVMDLERGVEKDSAPPLTGAGSEDIDAAVTKAIANFDLDLKYDYGSVAWVSDYKGASHHKSQAGLGLFVGPDYRIYVELVSTVQTDPETYELVRPLDSEAFKLVVHDGSNRIHIALAPQVQDKLISYARLVFEVPGNTTIGTITAFFNDDGTPQMAVDFDSAADATFVAPNIGKSEVKVWWVLNDAATATEIQTAIDDHDKAAASLPAVLYGFVSRFEPVYIHDFRRTLTLSCLMMGQCAILVQSDFYAHKWIPGDAIYMLMDPLSDLFSSPQSTRYTIQYLHKDFILAHYGGTGITRSYVFVGTYLGPTGHPYYKCCLASTCPTVCQTISFIS